MLFNSYEFILFFLPLTAIVFFRIGGIGHHRVAVAWLVAASLFFYGWWNPAYLWLILSSMFFNYAFGILLCRRPGKKMLVLGIACNLGLLGYFKYSNFLIQTLHLWTGFNFQVDEIVLPLAISFFTFQQLAYLVDAYRGETREYNFLHYCLFVVFFPQLIAGPIVHHREILPQFADDSVYRPNYDRIAAGLTIFFIGLFKKVIIADELSRYSIMAFDAASNGSALTFFEAWRGAFAYSFQLYFDFSGYSDMAIGISGIFGITLPLNFYSPYKADNIIEFWRRWHMTLSRFLKDYIYIPLGGSRKGRFRRYLNLMITMLLGGLWHGAGWTYIFWGGLHGLFLIINHGWHRVRLVFGEAPDFNSAAWRLFSRTLTFLCVTIGWVFFRAESFDSALGIFNGMIGLHGIAWPVDSMDSLGAFGIFLNDCGLRFEHTHYFKGGRDLLLILSLVAIVWFLPNTQQIMNTYHTVDSKIFRPCSPRLQWHPNKIWLCIIALISIVSIFKLSRISEFLYFQF